MVPRRQMSPPFDASSDSFRMGADRRLGAWRGEDRRVGAALSIERRARSRSYSDVYRRAKRSLHIVRSASDWGLTALSILNWVVMTLNFVLRTRASEIVILGGSASIGANVVDSGTSTSGMASARRSGSGSRDSAPHRRRREPFDIAGVYRPVDCTAVAVHVEFAHM